MTSSDPLFSAFNAIVLLKVIGPSFLHARFYYIGILPFFVLIIIASFLLTTVPVLLLLHRNVFESPSSHLSQQKRRKFLTLSFFFFIIPVIINQAKVTRGKMRDETPRGLELSQCAMCYGLASPIKCVETTRGTLSLSLPFTQSPLYEHDKHVIST